MSIWRRAYRGSTPRATSPAGPTRTPARRCASSTGSSPSARGRLPPATSSADASASTLSRFSGASTTTSPIRYSGHAEQWDRIDMAGTPGKGPASVAYRAKGRTLAVASVDADHANLQAEAALERGDERALSRIVQSPPAGAAAMSLFYLFSTFSFLFLSLLSLYDCTVETSRSVRRTAHSLRRGARGLVATRLPRTRPRRLFRGRIQNGTRLGEPVPRDSGARADARIAAPPQRTPAQCRHGLRQR